MADAAAPSPTNYANTPSDPSTWSPGFAAEMAASVATFQATQTAAANAASLSAMQPVAFLAAPSWTAQADALKAYAKAVDVEEDANQDANFVAMLRSCANTMAMLAQMFAPRYAKVGGSALSA